MSVPSCGSYSFEILGEKVSKTNFRTALTRQRFARTSITKAYPAEIYKQYGYCFRFVDPERSLINIVVSPEQIIAISGL